MKRVLAVLGVAGWVAWNAQGAESAEGAKVEAGRLTFAGYEWRVRSGEGGPGPNAWERRNVWVDEAGALHLRIRHENGKWSCAEVTMERRLGLGHYEFQVEGALGRFDPNVVLGLFNYPTGDVGGDGTHEIDIEFARWGRAEAPVGNFTIWPVEKALRQTTKPFAFAPGEGMATHGFEWEEGRVRFRSVRGDRWDGGEVVATWVFEPEDSARRISRQPMPVHLNLWLFRGRPPVDGQEVEVKVRGFKFVPR